MAKQVAATGPVDGPWALPHGWQWQRLGTILPLSYGKALKATQRRGGDVPVYGSSGPAGFHDEALCQESALIVGRKGSAGAVFHAIGPSYAIDTAYFCSTSAARFDLRLGYHLLSSLNLRKLDQSTAVPSLSRDPYNDLIVPVPPADVQPVIAARIDELFTEIDDGEAALARARDDLATWRKALLKAAVTGELTADWRVSHPPVETGAELMSRILADRRARWRMDPRNARKKYAEPNGIDIDSSETVPAGWAIASIEQVAFVENGQTPKGIDAAVGVTGDIPWFKVSSMNAPGNADLLTESKWWLSSGLAAMLGLRLHPAGSIVFPKRGGSIYTEKKRRLGRAGTVDLNVMAVVPLDDAASHLWTFFRNLSLRAISDGSNVPQINYHDVAQLRIKLPPSEEAQEISARVESALAITSQIEAEIDQFLLDAKMLRQSILAAAFRGELA